ncbi:protein-export membrane protein SecD [Candidatus Kaiserbacteria bacterium RIFCSPLOWO2_02_FULL_45_11b]|uniref:Protein translocase subunit SecD n=1 Tax=Candidatus Kaiserbacteria bacterium RIFCSPLOWO2_12_FULL_45_26 TaxID=1798525 RepID=A0A1F6FF50_9BACT|nr:MAG: protein-export membrane protein SecD [Candidatus Kaiserbacteria bacterium RIFCSPLOWO2_01_FULL_45_25]OGG81881.1 MAG: protein-export membrane protein SecD [Candidatus Kaiserbacteria bacterium RIFCSPLOWO2_02_FULL_45_11b]OGG84475.1 MAG: protein-export membrane protein SecD [Candidatus Kaiserbacteria bacterium RIFCSPLOWO2_12_FULL_45_26]
MTNSQNSSPRTAAFIRLFKAVAILGILGYLGFFVYSNATAENATHPFKLGLDLAGGAHLVYEADTTGVAAVEVPELMNVLRDVIERRVNLFGVSEPLVYVESSSFVSDVQQERLVVELPGVTDVAQAVAEIGRTPLLEFKLIDAEAMSAAAAIEQLTANASGGIGIDNVKLNGEETPEPYVDTGLTGRYLESARLEFTSGQAGQLANEPIVAITFNQEGGELFAEITRDNVGRQLAIFLDGEIISAPNINEAIVGGTAIISGGFDAAEARELAENLNFGALPVPIKLISTQTIDATLGAGVISQSFEAGVVGFGLISLFMLLWYRVAGIVASIALMFYVALSLTVFMLVPITLTAAGLAGLVLSLGMAVDANVLIFERMKEEYRSGKTSREAALEGFRRAWTAIWDSNITGLISAGILFWFGTSLIKGFALVLGIGILISMLSAIGFTRTLLIALPEVKREDKGVWSYLFGTGLLKK